MSSPAPTGAFVGPEETFGLPAPATTAIINGGTEVDYGVRMRPGDVITSSTTLGEYKEREGRLGLMLFTSTRGHLDQPAGRDGQDVARHADPVLTWPSTATPSPSAPSSPSFVRTTGFHNWNRYAAVNDEFVPIHMDDEAGRAQGFPGAFGMGNLMWSYLHNLLRDWMGDDGRIVTMACSFRSPNNRGMTVEARGTSPRCATRTAERLVDSSWPWSTTTHPTPCCSRDGDGGVGLTRADR